MAHPTTGRLRGKTIALARAVAMYRWGQITIEELTGIEATREDGTTFYPFKEFDPPVGRAWVEGIGWVLTI
jgi:hypothetical protein